MCSDLFSSCVLCVTPGLCSVYDYQLYRKMGMLYGKMGVLYIKKGVVLYRKMGVELFHSYVGMILGAVLV